MDDDVLVTRVCEALSAGTGWTWDATGTVPYPPDGVGIYYGPIGSLTEQGVGVTLYDATDLLLADGPTAAPQARRVQVRFRGRENAPASADQLASQAFRVLQGLSRVAGLNHAERRVVAPLGTDANKRPERADSYLVIPDTEA